MEFEIQGKLDVAGMDAKKNKKKKNWKFRDSVTR
jgi:hypothetical protein